MNKKSEKNQAKYNHERGTVLAVALLMTAGILILSMPFLTKLSGQYRMTENTYRSFAAINLAEAGLERAIWELNYGDISAWDGDDLLRTYSLPSVQAPDGRVIGDILITVATPGGGQSRYAQELQGIEGLPEWNSLFVVKSWQEKRPL